MNKNLFSKFRKKITFWSILFSLLTIFISFTWYPSETIPCTSAVTSTTLSAITSTIPVATPATINEVLSTFTVYYQGVNSDTTDETIESQHEIGSAFTLLSNNDTDFRAWYLTKEVDNQTLYYSYNATGELDWRQSQDVVAYHIFYNEDTISADECTKLSEGEDIYFHSIYSTSPIRDAVTSKWKGFEPYTAISNSDTLNHHIAYGKTYSKADGTVVQYNTQTDTTTGIRYVLDNDTRYYCVALGSYYGSVGNKHMVIMDNHVAFNIIVTDTKSIKDAICKTIHGEKYTVYHNKNGVFPVEHQHEYIEFVVDSDIVKKGHPAYKHGCLNVKFSIYDGNVKAIN